MINQQSTNVNNYTICLRGGSMDYYMIFFVMTPPIFPGQHLHRQVEGELRLRCGCSMFACGLGLKHTKRWEKTWFFHIYMDQYLLIVYHF